MGREFTITPFSTNSNQGCCCTVERNKKALPILNLPNKALFALKETLLDGSGMSAKKAGAYLGYRLITIVSLVANVVSTILSLILTILTLPLRCSEKTVGINSACVKYLKNSAANIKADLVDMVAFECRLANGQ